MTTCENISIIVEEITDNNINNNININNKEDDTVLDELFSLSRKKKKKDNDTTKISSEISTEKIKDDIILENMSEEDLLLDLMSLNGKKKHKKEKKKEKDVCKKFLELDDPPPYNYQVLLERFYSFIGDDTSKSEVAKKNVLRLPIVHRVGSKKTGWFNFKECCKSIGRDEATIINFIKNELSTEANIDGSGTLLIRGIYIQKNIENVLRKFLMNYVQCSICKSLETLVRKDQATRINFLDCVVCKSSKSLQQMVPVTKVGTKKVSFNL